MMRWGGATYKDYDCGLGVEVGTSVEEEFPGTAVVEEEGADAVFPTEDVAGRGFLLESRPELGADLGNEDLQNGTPKDRCFVVYL